jgi:hypothetical protein
LPLGLLGMIALVAVVETVVSLQPVRFLETASLSWRLAIEAIPREAEHCEVACLGDSLVKIGVIPEVVRDVSGRSTYNFAMAQAPAPATYFALRRLLDAGGKPSAIVVDFKPSLLAGGPKFSLRHWQTVLNAREVCELAVDTKNPALLIEIGLGRMLPSYRDRDQIREAVVAGLRGEVARNDETNRMALRNWTLNQGAHVNSLQGHFSGEVSPEIHKKLLSDAWKPHRVNVVYVDRILSLAEANRISVYWLIPPLSPELQERRLSSGVEAAYDAFVRSTQAKHPTVTVIDGRSSGYEVSTFADHTHLNGRGSIALSHDLAVLLKRDLSGKRWVALPRFRDVIPTHPLEDIEQSRFALKAETWRRPSRQAMRAN